MTASLVSRSLEDRNPSPAPLSSFASDDDDMDEPWDEPARRTTLKRASQSPLLSCVGEYFDSGTDDDVFEEGDLPSLRKKTRPTPLLNVRTSTTKPLRPPSMLGLAVPPNPEHHRGSNERSGSSVSTWDDDDDDEAPDDELASLEMRGIQRKKADLQQRPDEHYADVEEGEQDSQFCDVAAMLNNICGEKEAPSNQHNAIPVKKNLKSINDIPMGDHPIEEQTAIEIEYVEPDPREKRAAAISKKNSYLNSMARKAKEEFNKAIPEQVVIEEKKSELDALKEEEETDVYSSFNANEKRKFLKMVNSGLTPTQSAKKVIEDREAVSTPLSPRRGLAFWKKPKPERSVSSPNSREKTSPAGKVPVIDPPPNIEKESQKIDGVLSNGNSQGAYEPAAFDSESDEEVTARNTVEQNGDESAPVGRPKDGFVAVGAAPVVPTAVMSNKRVQPTVQEVLPKSGSNYYDAVRNDDGEEGKARRVSQLSQKASKARVSRSAVVRSPIPKQNGFTPLNEVADVTPVAAEKDQLTNTDVSQTLGGKRVSKTISARRFKMRGIRPTGFAAVPGDDSPARTSENSSTLRVESVVDERRNSAPADAVNDLASPVVEDSTVPELHGEDSPDELVDQPVDHSKADQAPGMARLAIDPVLPEEEEQSSFDLITPLSMAGSPRSKAVVVDGDPSNNQDYLGSTPSYGSNFDQMSVVSGKSHWTAATGASNFTTSSRVRRPGAAKIRLESAKKAQNAALTKKGWHESIKTAAAKSNQIWDPREGFVDYQDATVSRGERNDNAIHIELKGLKKRNPGVQESNYDDFSESRPPVLAPGTDIFDGESNDDVVWDEGEDDEDGVVGDNNDIEDNDFEVEEDPHQLRSDTEEEDSILNDSTDGGSIQHIIQNDVQLLETNESDDDEDVFLLDSSISPSQPASSLEVTHDNPRMISDTNDSTRREENEEWIQTMKEASAKYARNGATWHPDTGWQGLGEAEEAPDSPSRKSIGIDPPIEPYKNNGSEAPDPDGISPVVVSSELEAMTSAPVISSSGHTRDENTSLEAPTETLDESIDAEVARTGVLFSMDKVAIDLGDRPRPPSQTSRSIGDADTITTFQDEKYVQIGETGSVRSFQYNQSPVDQYSKSTANDKSESSVNRMHSVDPSTMDVPTDDDTTAFLVSDDFLPSTDRTEVVKVKNTEDDISLFAHDSRHSFARGDNSVQSSKRRGQGPVDVDEIDDFNRRGHGPVDLDEVDEMEFDDEEDDDKAWPSTQIGSSEGIAGSSKSKKPSSLSPPKIKASSKDTIPRSDRRRPLLSPRVDPQGSKAADSNSFRASETTQELSPRDPNEVWNAVYGDDSESENVPGAPRGDPNGVSSISRSLHSADIFKTSSPDIESTSVVKNVKNLAKQWESRASGATQNPDNETSPRSAVPSIERSNPGTAEWKSFLDKKVSAESAAAAKMVEAQGLRPDPTQLQSRADPSDDRVAMEPEETHDDDSLFEFKASGRDETGAFPTATSSLGELDDSFSDISPIQAREDDYDDDFEEVSRSMEAVSDTGTNIEQGSFLKRLQACAAPIMPGNSSSHLSFLRSPTSGTGGSSPGRFLSPDLCGRPDTISEDVDLMPSPVESQRSSSSKRSRPRSSPRNNGSETKSITSDDGFGSKTSYLERLAMEAAVSKPKRHGSRGRANDDKSRSSNLSDVSASSSRRSEKWQEFVDRKSIGISPEKQRTESVTGTSDHSSEVSKAAERYAAKQVEAMMEAMSRRRELEKSDQLDGINDSPVALSPSGNPGSLSPYEISGARSDGSRTIRSVQVKNESVRAAEELAAARVEAMMAAMTSRSLEEGEI